MTGESAGGASAFAALLNWERKDQRRRDSDGSGTPKVQIQGKGGKLRLGGGAKKGVRFFHKGHYLSGTKINNVVKVKYVKNNNDARRHMIEYIDYIEKRERDVNEPERKFYGRDGVLSRDKVVETMMTNRGDDAAMFKLILSPKQNELDHIQYTSEIMQRFEKQTGIKTDWSVVEHKNTEYHHVHIVMPGRDMNGNSYRLEREHLDLFRELANEYQYELQDRVYEQERQIELEFGLTEDEAHVLIESQRDKRDMKELGVTRPDVDKLVRDELARPTNFDPVSFSQQLQKEIGEEAAKDFAPSKQTDIEQDLHLDRLDPESPESVQKEAHVLLALASPADQVDRETDKDKIDIKQPGKDGPEDKDQAVDWEKSEDKEEIGRTNELSADAMVLADKLESRQELAGLTGINHPTFTHDQADLQAEARMLFHIQQELTKVIESMDMQIELTDQDAFKIEDTVKERDDELKDHDKESEHDERGI